MMSDGCDKGTNGHDGGGARTDTHTHMCVCSIFRREAATCGLSLSLRRQCRGSQPRPVDLHHVRPRLRPGLGR